MKIEIAEPGRMMQSGSSLLRLIQNNSMPDLDLLVRESIQNSLDAVKPHQKYAEVKFITGSFNTDKLNNELEIIDLKKKYKEDEYDFIAVRDSNTSGLTGPMNYSQVAENKFGNLLKLVYEICKPQENEGSGGSWGIGKTVYFRMGIGLVCYYSRILNDNGEYESRLAATLVEDETLPDAIIPPYAGTVKRGIAWWGKDSGANMTEPETDEAYINTFLDIFGLAPYSGNETGTTIIIPFTDYDALLASNQTEYLDATEQPRDIYFRNDISEYIKTAASRWYSPRLGNPNYTYGAWLRLFVNGKGIAASDMAPVFQVVQALYNRANNVVPSNPDILDGNDSLGKESIVIKKFMDDSCAGTAAYVKVSRDTLKMGVPDNNPEPYIFFNNEMPGTDYKNPIVCYTRKPGMIVSYECTGSWVPSITSDEDNYIIGIFVLNSFNKMKPNPAEVPDLEEYVRRSEMADHCSWSDWSKKSFNPRIVGKIKDKVKGAIDKAYRAGAKKTQPKEMSGLGALIGSMLLPPEGFGSDASQKGNRKTPVPSPSKSFKFGIDSAPIKYSSNVMTVPVVLNTTKKKELKFAAIETEIDSEAGKISFDAWEKGMSTAVPFEIHSADIEIESPAAGFVTVTSVASQNACGIDFSIPKTSGGKAYRLDIHPSVPVSVKMKIKLNIEITSRDVKPAFVFSKEV